MSRQEERREEFSDQTQKLILNVGMSTSPSSIIRRILVALDASTHSLAALEAAAKLAAQMEAELLGLFVEDINLLQLAELPFAQEMSRLFTAGQQVDKLKMERALRVQAEQARQALAITAEQMRVRWSFRVVRGQVISEILTAALEADLLSLGKISRPLTHRLRLGSTARAAVTKAPHSVLLTQHGMGIKQPVMVVYDESSKTSKHVLEVATTLTQVNGGELIVFILADTLEVARRLEDEISKWLQGQKLQVRYRWLNRLDVPGLIQTLQMKEGGVLVLDGESSFLEGEVIQKLLDEIDCPILLVR